jgi:ornithine carbamoyltransferase
MTMMGGHALFLGSDDIQVGVNESIADTAKVLSRFNSTTKKESITTSRSTV